MRALQSMVRRTALMLVLPLATPLAAAPATPYGEEIQAYYEDHLAELFVWFHQNPELSRLETRTAARLATELRDLGVEVTEVGGTGLVGVIDNGPGPTLLIRADMDGLPVAEASGLPYASTARQVNLVGDEVPVMHACGHDVHITSLVGTAKLLLDHRDAWRGRVLLVGQPPRSASAAPKPCSQTVSTSALACPIMRSPSMFPRTDRRVEDLGLARVDHVEFRFEVDIIVHGIGAQ